MPHAYYMCHGSNGHLQGIYCFFRASPLGCFGASCFSGLLPAEAWMCCVAPSVLSRCRAIWVLHANLLQASALHWASTGNSWHLGLKENWKTYAASSVGRVCSVCLPSNCFSLKTLLYSIDSKRTWIHWNDGSLMDFDAFGFVWKRFYAVGRLEGSDPYGVEMQEDRSRFQWLQQLAEEAALGELDPRKGPGLSRSCLLSGRMVELYIQTVKQDLECLGASQKVRLYIWVSQKLGETWWDSECETQDNNQLWIGRGGSLTPCHYDKAENLHMQICGQKTFLLIPPDQTFVPGLQLQKLLLKIVCNFVCPDELKSFGCFLRLCTLILLIILWTLSPWWILMRQICNDSRQDQKVMWSHQRHVSCSVNTDDWFEDLTALLIWSLLK